MTDRLPFVDANVFLRHLLQDNIEQSPRASALIEAIDRRGVRVQTTDTVVFEVVYVLQKLYHLDRAAIAQGVGDLASLAGLVLPTKRLYGTTLERYVAHPGLSFADAFHSVLVQRELGGQLLSFDRDFDRFPGITRVEPA